MPWRYILPALRYGQFGTRLLGGKDHASARYVFTRLQKITRLIFPAADDPVLDYLEDEEALAHRERLILSRHALHASRLTFRHPGYA